MRFFLVVLAATLLASVKGDSTEMNHVSQLVQEIASRSVVSVQDANDVKRNLRKYVEERDSLDLIDALDSIDEPEERVPFVPKKFVGNTGAVRPDDIVNKIGGDRLKRLEVNLAALRPAAQPAGLRNPKVIRVDPDVLLAAFHQQRIMEKHGAAAALKAELSVKDVDLKPLFGDDLLIYLGLLQKMNKEDHQAHIRRIMSDEFGFNKRLGLLGPYDKKAKNHALFMWLYKYPFDK